MSLNLFVSPINLGFIIGGGGSQPRTSKDKGKIIFPFLCGSSSSQAFANQPFGFFGFQILSNI